MRYTDFEQFKARHPELGKVILENPKNEFCQDIRERIEKGMNITKRQREALNNFRDSVVIFEKGQEVKIPVTLTGKPDEKGVRFNCLELRITGRFTWVLYEELVPKAVRDQIEGGNRVDGIIVTTKIEWVSPDGNFVIGNLVDLFTPGTKRAAKLAGEAVDAILKSPDIMKREDVEEVDEEAWESHRAKVTEKPKPVKKPRGHRGVYYHRTLRKGDEFFNITVDEFTPKGHENLYRIIEHSGDTQDGFDARGRLNRSSKHSLRAAMGHADELFCELILMGYTIADEELCFGHNLDDFEDVIDSRIQNAWYDQATRRVRTTDKEECRFGIPQISKEAEVDRAFFEEGEDEEIEEPPDNARQALLPRFANWKDSF